MSIFKTQARTFTTTITGEPLELKINNMVWIILQDKFGITQLEYAERGSEEESVMSIKFITSVLLANGLEVSEEEVAENTDAVSILEFNYAYNQAVNPALGKALEKMSKEVKKGN